MRPKFNVVGDTFTYTHGGNKGYSVHGKAADLMEWVQDGSADDTFYIDTWGNEAFADGRSGKKYLWLLESRSVYPHLAEKIKMNVRRYVNTFDLIFTHDQELLRLGPKFKFVPAQWSWIDEPNIREKTKLVSMISSSKNFFAGHSYRLKWVDRLKDDLDLYGRGFNEIDKKEKGLDDYMFSVAIENGVYRTYFTEKIIDCFLTGTVPVYYGTPDIGDHFNADGIITLREDFCVDQLTPELYESKKEAIEENFQTALDIGVLEDYIYRNYLRGDSGTSL